MAKSKKKKKDKDDKDSSSKKSGSKSGSKDTENKATRHFPYEGENVEAKDHKEALDKLND